MAVASLPKNMNSIEAMTAEVKYQVQDLPKMSLPPPGENCLFVGSGDSYASSLAAEYFSGIHAVCCYPTDILYNPSMVKGRNVYIVSISGSTKDNILAAMTAKKHGAQTTAITARPTSKLANVCNRTIQLKYRSIGVTTAGTISFTSSMLTCASLAKKVQGPLKIDRLFRQAKNQADLAANEIIRRKVFGYFILGNGLLYPTALYGALKLNEIFGAQAVSYPLEEFCHSPLFSIRKSIQTIIMGTNNNGRALDKRLRLEGFSSVFVKFENEGIELLLQSAFFIQLLMLNLARKRRITNCYFLKDKRLLKLSSGFIY